MIPEDEVPKEIGTEHLVGEGVVQADQIRNGFEDIIDKRCCPRCGYQLMAIEHRLA